MKKIIALMLILALSVFAFAACGGSDDDDTTPAEKTYSLALAVDTTIDGAKVTNYVTTLVLDDANKIVAVRIDCVEATATLENGAVANVASVASKVEQGDNYAMNSGSFAKQVKAFEDAIVGKTADEVANLDMSLVAGCTMPYSPYSFKAVVAKAFASTNKTTFKTADSFTLGLANDMSISVGKATTYYAGTVVAGGKIVATIIDCGEVTLTVADGAITGTYAGTKVEQGDNYAMNSGSFAKQTEAFENAIAGKTATEVTNLDMSLVAGCTMPYSPASFKAVVVESITNAR